VWDSLDGNGDRAALLESSPGEGGRFDLVIASDCLFFKARQDESFDPVASGRGCACSLGGVTPSTSCVMVLSALATLACIMRVAYIRFLGRLVSRNAHNSSISA